MTARSTVLVLVVALAVPARAAHANDCATEAAELRTHLTVEKRRAFRWNTAWAIAFGAAAAGQLTLALTKYRPIGEFDRDYEETLYVGAAKASIGVAARLVLPLRITVPPPAADPCSDVVALRSALADAGRRERRSFWLTHLGGTALNLAGAALLTHRRSFKVGAISFAISYPVGPANAYTQPRRSWKLWRERRATWAVGLSAGPSPLAPSPSTSTTWTAWVGGTW